MTSQLRSNQIKEILCDYCKKQIIRKAYKINQSERHFCNTECKNNYKYKPGERTTLTKEPRREELESKIIKLCKEKPTSIKELREVIGSKYIEIKPILVSLKSRKILSCTGSPERKIYTVNPEALPYIKNN